MIEREPITVVVSQKGWIRALKGHVADLSTLHFKGDDALETAFFAETTSKILVLASNGKVFTLDAAKLPGGRGHGEPIRLMADIDEDAEHRRVSAAIRRARRCCSSATTGAASSSREDDLIVDDAQGPRGAQRRRAGAAEDRRAGAGRSCRDHRREPQAAGVSAQRGAAHGARQGRAHAALQGRRRLRRQGVRAGRGLDLDRFLRPRFHRRAARS